MNYLITSLLTCFSVSSVTGADAEVESVVTTVESTTTAVESVVDGVEAPPHAVNVAITTIAITFFIIVFLLIN